jgi:hypothetical protein
MANSLILMVDTTDSELALNLRGFFESEGAHSGEFYPRRELSTNLWRECWAKVAKRLKLAAALPCSSSRFALRLSAKASASHLVKLSTI